MAVELDFEWGVEVANEVISKVTSETLMVLLNLDSPPNLHVEGSAKICEGDVRIKLGETAEVELLIYQVQVPCTKTQACVSYAVFRSSASRILCLAVALGMAKEFRVLVKDYANLYGLGTSLDPVEALENLRIKGEPGPFQSQVDLLNEVIRGQNDI